MAAPRGESERGGPEAAAGDLPDLDAVWERFVERGELDAGVRPAVREAWRRCLTFGVDPRRLAQQPPDPAALSRARARSAAVLEAAAPLLEAAHRSLAERPHLLVLLDDRAVVLQLFAAGVDEDQRARSNLFEGASWTEKDLGCNGGGSAIAEARPVLFLGSEHFVEAYRGWTCMGAPIRSPEGRVVGAVDLSVPNGSAPLGAWGWLQDLVKAVEAALVTGPPEDGAAEAAVAGVDDPFHAVRAALEFLGSQPELLPSHRRLLDEARAATERAKQRLETSLAKLDEVQGELERANLHLRLATLDAEERTEETAAASSEAEDFVRVAAHDMRQPLTAVSTTAALLHRSLEAQGLERPAAQARRILENGTRLSDMLGELVDAARLESGTLQLERVPLDLGELVADVLARMAGTDGRERLRLEAPDGVCRVVGDRGALERVAINLVTNALKYDDGRSPIVVRLAREGTEVCLSVQDRGPGIPREALPHLFDRYYRVGGGARRDGLGLGLYITRMFVEVLRGTIGVRSREGEGSTFEVRLPAAP